MGKRTYHGTTTITLSIPLELREFYDELSDDGYNRSHLMLGMSTVLRNLYKHHDKFPGGLPAAIRCLKSETAKTDFFQKLVGSNPKKASGVK